MPTTTEYDHQQKQEDQELVFTFIYCAAMAEDGYQQEKENQEVIALAAAISASE